MLCARLTTPSIGPCLSRSKAWTTSCPGHEILPQTPSLWNIRRRHPQRMFHASTVTREGAAGLSLKKKLGRNGITQCSNRPSPQAHPLRTKPPCESHSVVTADKMLWHLGSYL